jgi:hypothetical protein
MKGKQAKTRPLEQEEGRTWSLSIPSALTSSGGSFWLWAVVDGFEFSR